MIAPKVRTVRKPCILFALGLLTCTLGAQSRGPLELADAAVPAGARRIAYGDDALQFGELRLPATKGPHPVAIVVHGGCYLSRIDGLEPRAVAVDNMRPFAAALTVAGVATWNIEYRRIGDSGGGWPGTFLDVARATDFLRTLAKNNDLDLTRTIAIGHSAGGHLAMWLAARAKVPAGSEVFTRDPLPLTGALNLDGPADLKATLEVQESICGSPVVTQLLAGLPEQRPERYRATSPIELLPYGGRQVFLAGRMFGAQVPSYEAAARQAGENLQATAFPDAGHFLFIDPQSEIWPAILKIVQNLLSIPDR